MDGAVFQASLIAGMLRLGVGPIHYQTLPHCNLFSSPGDADLIGIGVGGHRPRLFQASVPPTVVVRLRMRKRKFSKNKKTFLRFHHIFKVMGLYEINSRPFVYFQNHKIGPRAILERASVLPRAHLSARARGQTIFPIPKIDGSPIRISIHARTPHDYLVRGPLHTSGMV